MLSGRKWAGIIRVQGLALGLCLLLAGCGEREIEATPVVTPAPEPPAAVSVSPVYTDWSKLEPYEAPEVKYTRRREEHMDRLIPAEDYGAVIPFAGASLTRMESWSGYHDSYSLYGLVTPEGEVVADPVFTSAHALTGWDSYGNPTEYPGVWLLGKPISAPGKEEPEEWFALCAKDGSWCTDFLYDYDWERMMAASFDGGLPLPCRGGDIALVDPNSGKELRRVDCSAWLTDTAYWNGIYVDPDSGYLSANLYDWEADARVPLVFDPQGERVALPPEVCWVGQCGDGLIPAQIMEAGTSAWYGYVDAATGQWAIAPTYRNGETFSHGVAPVSDGINGYFIDKTGRALTGGYPTQFQRHGDYWYFMTENWSVAAVFDQEGHEVESPLVWAGSPGFEGEGWVTVQGETERLLIRGAEVHSFPQSLGWINGIRGDRILFQTEGENPTVTLVNLEGKILARWEGEGSGYFDQNELTGESYVQLYSYSSQGSQAGYYDLDGKELFPIQGYHSLYGDLLYRYDEGYSSLTDQEGELVFGWRYPLAED